MATTGAFYRSNHPDVVAAWKAAEKARRKHRLAMDAFEEKWCPMEGLRLYHEGRTFRPMFFAYVPWRDQDRVPAAWARYQGDPAKIRPRLSGKGVDKDLLAAWRDLQMSSGDIALPGMPQHVFTGMSDRRPGVELRADGYVYVDWGTSTSHDEVAKASFYSISNDGERKESEKLSLDLWERLKASEWFALIEEREAASAS